ncbi:hypothetical protein T4B_3299 [Trichinella pseudospiralis]|uniref:Secreted protein n=1 Tax=Trichinella pseudospiralis TaxID=6337 RepID=A0A0V1K3E2_TRIPS|nr:hypothetical protein T4B_3299 [Trichinella pseudospiralis]KRZ41756.1 hypothetical protein T4C_10394 [Trichinella pseudospiralis]
MSPDKAIFIHLTLLLLPQHGHISGSPCWAANNWSLSSDCWGSAVTRATACDFWNKMLPCRIVKHPALGSGARWLHPAESGDLERPAGSSSIAGTSHPPRLLRIHCP